MNEIIPTIGRQVIYTPTAAEKNEIAKLGWNAQEEMPATIVSTWGKTPQSAVNLKVKVDGNHPDLWKTSLACAEADENGIYPEGSWHWPIIKK